VRAACLSLPLLALAGAMVSNPRTNVVPVDTPAATASCPDGGAWTTLLVDHARRYPLMGTADVYKLLHQATMGSAHVAPNRDIPAAWLRAELSEMGEGPPEPLIDPLGETGRVVRIHLRSFIAQGGDAEQLLGAFVETASAVPPDPAALRCALDVALRTREHLSAASWSASEFSGYIAARAGEGYPAVHHSEGFASTYRPAYRVIAVQLVPTAVRGMR
jgi:hypothetical protein